VGSDKAAKTMSNRSAAITGIVPPALAHTSQVRYLTGSLNIVKVMKTDGLGGPAAGEPGQHRRVAQHEIH
jgi:hypothetical protein